MIALITSVISFQLCLLFQGKQKTQKKKKINSSALNKINFEVPGYYFPFISFTFHLLSIYYYLPLFCARENQSNKILNLNKIQTCLHNRFFLREFPLVQINQWYLSRNEDSCHSVYFEVIRPNKYFQLYSRELLGRSDQISKKD